MSAPVTQSSRRRQPIRYERQQTSKIFTVDQHGVLVERETACTLKMSVPGDVDLPTLLLQLASEQTWRPGDSVRIIIHQREVRSAEIGRAAGDARALPLIVSDTLCTALNEIREHGYCAVTCRVGDDGRLLHHVTEFQDRPGGRMAWQPGDQVEIIEDGVGTPKIVRVTRAAARLDA
jgi:hypothetical protein